MDSELSTLLGIASEPIVASKPSAEVMASFLKVWGEAGVHLGQVLCVKNGFWAYESSLLVRPLQNGSLPLGIVEWNRPELWKHVYGFEMDQILFFAEDAFGCQYCVINGEVGHFDPETGKIEILGKSLGLWAKIVTKDYEYRTGYPLAHAWQVRHQSLQPGCRLIPNIPFVLGGKYELENLHVGDDVEGMVFRASIAAQIRDVPDDSQVVINLVNNEEQSSGG